MDIKLTETQIETLRTAYVLYGANGNGTRSMTGRKYRSLEAKGLFTSVKGASISGGRHARWYKFTITGLQLAEKLYAERK